MANTRTLTYLRNITSSAAAPLNAPAGKMVTLERIILEDPAAAGSITISPIGDNLMQSQEMVIDVALLSQPKTIEIMHTYDTGFEIAKDNNNIRASVVYRVY